MQSDKTSTIWVPIRDGDQDEDHWIPEGFVLVIGPDEKAYILPEFMLPDLDQSFNARKRAKELKASNAAGMVGAGCDTIRHLFHTNRTLRTFTLPSRTSISSEMGM